MRTTNKQFKGLVQSHVIACLNEEYGSTIKEQLQAVVDSFKDWYSDYEQKMTPNRWDAFKEFMLGLPSTFNIEFEYSTIYETLKFWWEQCGEEYREQSADKEANLYYHLVTREFNTLCRKEGITW